MRRTLLALACLLVAATPAGVAATGDPAQLELTGTTTFDGVGGDRFVLTVPVDVSLNLGSCGHDLDGLDSHLCDLDLATTAPFAGLLIHEPITVGNEDDFAYVVLAEFDDDFGSDYVEAALHRGLDQMTIGGQEHLRLPAGRYAARLLSDGAPVTADLHVDGLTGTSTATGAPGTMLWRDLEALPGSATVGGAGADFDNAGPTLSWFGYGWQDSLPSNVDAYFGWCIYGDPTTMPDTAYAPGCPDRVTGANGAAEYNGAAAVTPGGGTLFLADIGGPDRFALGAYHGSVARPTAPADAFALTVPLG